MSKETFSAISIFSGAMGLDLGVEKAGFEIKACVELNKYACMTIRENKPHLPLIEGDVSAIEGKALLDLAGVKDGELTLLFGGPPCQSFSTAGRRQSFKSAKGNALLEFIRLIDEMKPEYFIFENVKGILSASIEHRPLAERGKDFPPLSENEKPGSVISFIEDEINRMGYKLEYQLLNSANYGVPQTRQRVFFIGSRDGHAIKLPEQTHYKDEKIGTPWITFDDIIDKSGIADHTFNPYKGEKLEYMKMIPKGGGNWRDLPEGLQEKAMGGAFKSGGGKVGFYRRISGGRPAPTMLTSPTQKSTNLGHPYENRPLSIEEYKAIQQFPQDWKLSGSLSAQYKQVGNAVPVGLAYAIGKAVYDHIKEMRKSDE